MDNFYIRDTFFDVGRIKQFYEGKEKGYVLGMYLNYNGKKYKVFNPELFAILTSKEIPSLFGVNSFDGTSLMSSYTKGFQKGNNYFKKTFEIKPDTLFNNQKSIVDNLHINYYHKAPGESKPWRNWIESYPIVISKNEIEKYGYYAGVKTALDELIDKYSVVFKNFDVCSDSIENGEQMLSSLLIDNEKYRFFISAYPIKQQRTENFLSKIEFADAELKRIYSMFLKKKVETTFSVENIDGNGTIATPNIPYNSFDFSIYAPFAFNTLSMGNDGEIKSIVSNAKRSWISAMKREPPPDFENGVIDNLKEGVAYLLYEKYLKEQLKNRKSNQFEIVSAPVIALFCSIINQSKTIIRGDESAPNFCKRVCEQFKVAANPDKVRQFYSDAMELRANDKYLKKVIKLLLPKLPKETRQKIEAYIDNEMKLYG